MCSNTLGSYACACKAGYSGDGKTCTGKLYDVIKKERRISCRLKCGTIASTVNLTNGLSVFIGSSSFHS